MGEKRRFYNAKFYRELEATRDSARAILPIVFELLHPTSIVDIGCGTGHWLATGMELGVNDALGIDGEWALQAGLQIPRDKFLARDLSKPLSLNRKFDLAICLEVAEHLPETSANDLVQTLCDSADSILFSAAIPGQGGRHHLNEQWPAYWAGLFSEHAFDCHDVLRPTIWDNPRVLWYYAQNCLLFARAESSNHLSRPVKPLALVHPQLWSAQRARFNSPAKLLERLPKALSSALFKRK